MRGNCRRGWRHFWTRLGQANAGEGWGGGVMAFLVGGEGGTGNLNPAPQIEPAALAPTSPPKSAAALASFAEPTTGGRMPIARPVLPLPPSPAEKRPRLPIGKGGFGARGVQSVLHRMRPSPVGWGHRSRLSNVQSEKEIAGRAVRYSIARNPLTGRRAPLDLQVSPLSGGDGERRIPCLA